MKNYGEVVAATREENVLFSILLELTYSCNLNCFYCYNDVGLTGPPLRLEQYHDLLEDLAEMQVMHLVLSGGEPLAHPDVFEIGLRAKRLGFAVRLKTNGYALHGETLDDVLEKIDPLIIEVTLHGATADVHDRQTQVDGSFDRLLANLKEIVSRGVRAKLNATLTAWNEHQTEAMFELADSLGLRIQFDADVTPRDDGDRAPLQIGASQNGLEQLLHLQLQRSVTKPSEPPVMREGDQLVTAPSVTRHCGAGCATVTIDPFGTVYPCVQWRRRLGSLHENSILEIWNSRGELETVRRLNSDARRAMARVGDDANLAAFCPGLAEQQTGSPLEMYPGAEARIAAGRKLGLRTQDAGD